MASTLAQLRAMVREEIGDEERLSGTASGGSLTEIVDSSRLIQGDNFWLNQKVFVKTTTDALAPQGEARRISASTLSTTKLTVALPFSAAVQSGDTYGIASFSDSQVNRAINNAVVEFSKYVPWKTTETLSVTNGGFRFSPTSAASIKWVERIEFVDNAAQQHIKYDGLWKWDESLRQVEFSFWWSESKSLTMHFARDHRLLSVDADETSVRASEEMFLVKLAAADLILTMSAKEFKDDYGNLRPKSWRDGDVSEDYGNVQDRYKSMRDSVIAQLKELTTEPVIGMYPRWGRLGTAASIAVNTNADPDGRAMPQLFWTLN